jgi:hypothetical protein
VKTASRRSTKDVTPSAPSAVAMSRAMSGRSRGRDFFGVLAAINAWGDRWLTGDDGIPVVMHHTACDHDSQAKVVCSSCGESLHHQDIAVRTGPGYPARLLDDPGISRRFSS